MTDNFDKVVESAGAYILLLLLPASYNTVFTSLTFSGKFIRTFHFKSDCFVTCDPSEEKTLLHRLALGEEAAFGTIYEKYAPALVSYTAARLSSLAEAKDLIHDLFVYVWEEKANLRITHSLQAFLFAAARYRIIDHIRRNATRDKYAAVLQTLSPVENANIENDLAAKDLQQTIENAVQDLPPRVKKIYQLSRDQHYTVLEIATELNLSPQTVKNQLTTALGYLRSMLVKLTVLLVCLCKCL